MNKAKDVPAAGETTDSGLRSALDTLEEKVKFLIARHGELAGRYAEAAAAQKAVEEGIDPHDLDERVNDLRDENDRLARHVEYLENRIQDLLTRVRYVIDA